MGADFGRWLASLDAIEWIGLLGGFASLIGLAFTLRALFRAKTRADLAADQLRLAQDELELEKRDRMAAERRAETAENEAERASPAGILQYLEELKRTGKIKQWVDQVEQLDDLYPTFVALLLEQINLEISMLSSVDDIGEAIAQLECKANAANLLLGPSTEVEELRHAISRVAADTSWLEETSTSASYLGETHSADADVNRLNGIADKLDLIGGRSSGLPTAYRALNMVNHHFESVAPEIAEETVRLVLNTTSMSGELHLFKQGKKLGEQTLPRMRSERSRERLGLFLDFFEIKRRIYGGDPSLDMADLDAIRERALVFFGTGSGNYLSILQTLVVGLVINQRYNLDISSEVVEQRIEKEGPYSHDTLTARFYHGRMLVTAGRLEEAKQEFEEILPLKKRYKGEKHGDTIATVEILRLVKGQLSKQKT